jgi:hypothetical protein
MGLLIARRDYLQGGKDTGMGIELGVRVSAGIVIVIVIGKGIAINFIASQVHASELGIVVMSRTTHLATESI